MSTGAHWSATACALIAVLGSLLGCGASSSAGAPAPFAPSPQPTFQEAPSPLPPTVDLPPTERAAHIEDALAQLTDAERAVDQQLAHRPAHPKASPKPGPPSTSPERPREAAPSEPCDVACVALASMRRSASYLCKLAGASDSRCSDARDRVRRAEDRVTSQCGACPTDTPLSWQRDLDDEIALAPRW